jgi:peptide/nickel transport system permease protein
VRFARRASWSVLVVVGLLAVFPDFFAPYSPARQHRDLPYAPPGRYGAPSVMLLVHGDSYRWLGVVPGSMHLIGAGSAGRIFVLGTDELGRDWFSRICHGASISLLLAPAAAAMSMLLAVTLGMWAGVRGGVVDAAVMRASETFVVLPWFYVVIAFRAALPLMLGAPATLLAVFGLLAVLGAAAPARLFRGLVLSLRHREFVVASRAAGAGEAWIFRRHLLPHLRPAVWAQLLVSIPTYIITEATLSFMGLGIAEPVPTWGSMLAPLQQYVVITSYPWMWAPAAAIVIVCVALQVVARPGLEGDAGSRARRGEHRGVVLAGS